MIILETVELMDTLRKFLVVAGSTDKTIRWPSYNCKGGNLMLYMFILESVELMDTYKLISGRPYRTETLKQLLSMEIAYNNIM